MPSSRSGSHSLTLMIVGGDPATSSVVANDGQASGLRPVKASIPYPTAPRLLCGRHLLWTVDANHFEVTSSDRGLRLASEEQMRGSAGNGDRCGCAADSAAADHWAKCKAVYTFLTAHPDAALIRAKLRDLSAQTPLPCD